MKSMCLNFEHFRRGVDTDHNVYPYDELFTAGGYLKTKDSLTGGDMYKWGITNRRR